MSKQKKCNRNTSSPRFNLMVKFPGWTIGDGSIPCPPKEYGGCGYQSMNLSRIFKMNWVAKLVKNVEEMASGCKVNDAEVVWKTLVDDTRLCQCAHRENGEDNYLYYPSCKDTRAEVIGNFRKHWAKGEPVIIRQVCDRSSMSVWHPKDIWRGIRETADEKMKAENRRVKAINCFDCFEVDIELDQFIKGYSDGRMCKDGRPEILKLKDWPSPSASEEFLLYHRPEFINKLPLLEYIHSRLGFLNVAAKLPHYSLQNDVGPKIFISYGNFEELGRGNSVVNLHLSMRDMVYLLVHTCEMKLQKAESSVSSILECEMNEVTRSPSKDLDEQMLPEAPLSGLDRNSEAMSIADENHVEDVGIENIALKEKNVNSEQSTRHGGEASKNCPPGSCWDVFRRQDVPKLIEFLRKHRMKLGNSEDIMDDFVTRPLYDESVYLNGDSKQKLKEEFGVEPWSFEQHLGEAVFVPAGCPFQVRNLQSTVQLGLDFLSPDSMGEAVRLADEIRLLPNDHEAKLQVLEVGKISLYAASSAIKEVQKLVLDPKFGSELGFEDPNLTAAVSHNLDIAKNKQVSCS